MSASGSKRQCDPDFPPNSGFGPGASGKREGNERHEFGLPLEVEGGVRYRGRELGQAGVPESMLKALGVQKGRKRRSPSIESIDHKYNPSGKVPEILL